jgi:hypothetical protein
MDLVVVSTGPCWCIFERFTMHVVSGIEFRGVNRPYHVLRVLPFGSDLTLYQTVESELAHSGVPLTR